MDYFVVEVLRQNGWFPVNVMKSQGGRLAIELAERIRRSLHPRFPRHSQRVRRVDHEDYVAIGTELAGRYKCQDRFDRMEDLLVGCDALISI